MARSWPSNWFNKLDLPAFGRPTIATRIPFRTSCPSFAVASSWSINASADSSRFSRPPIVSGSMSSSGKSMCASTCASTCMVSSRSWLIRCDNFPASCSLAAFRARSVRAWIRSATASACARSIRPWRNARLVNSPGRANRAPALSTASSTARVDCMPPWQLISTMSSRVNVAGARITDTITSSIRCEP